MTEIIKHLAETSSVHLAHELFQLDFTHLNKPIFPHCFKSKKGLIFIVDLSERMQSALRSLFAHQRTGQRAFLWGQVVFGSVKTALVPPLG